MAKSETRVTVAEKSDAQIKMTKTKDCKACVRYDSPDPEALIQNVYLSRKAFEAMPDAVVISVAKG